MTDYPPEWKSGDIQRTIYALAGWRCEHCGCEFVPGSTKARYALNADGKPRILTVHHLDGNPANCEYSNLVALCQNCHLHIQGVWKPGGILPADWPQPPDWILIRDLSWQSSPQLVLSGWEELR
jgi:hypothetical protein